MQSGEEDPESEFLLLLFVPRERPGSCPTESVTPHEDADHLLPAICHRGVVTVRRCNCVEPVDADYQEVGDRSDGEQTIRKVVEDAHA